MDGFRPLARHGRKASPILAKRKKRENGRETRTVPRGREGGTGETFISAT